MTTLKDARQKGKLDEFIKEREGETGDAERVSRAVSSMARRSSEAPKASGKGNRDG